MGAVCECFSKPSTSESPARRDDAAKKNITNSTGANKGEQQKMTAE